MFVPHIVRAPWVIAILACVTASTIAQPPFSGGPLMSGPGGPPPFGGPGGPPGGFDMEEMIRRVDANGNGAVEPEELQSRTGYFAERALREANFDTSKGVPLDQLLKIMRERMERFRSGDDRGRDDRERDDRDRRDSTPSRTPATPVSLVPGFGNTTEVALAPGFGPPDPLESIEKKYDRGTVDRVKESLARYDRNGDGYLDADEMRDARWSTDPRESDKNKDGRLSREEIAQRYHERYNGGSSGSSSWGSRGGPPGGFMGPSGGMPSATVTVTTSPSSSSAGSLRSPPISAPSSAPSSSSSVDAKIQSYADGMLRQYDVNKDGVLQKDEWSKMPRDPKAADKNNDDLVTREELAQRLAGYSRGSGSSSSGSSSSGSSSRGGSSASNRGPSGSASGRKSYRFLSPTERLPEGLPSWFARSDEDGDGQILMREFAAAWTDQRAAEFARYDTDGDGVITSREALASERK